MGLYAKQLCGKNKHTHHSELTIIHSKIWQHCGVWMLFFRMDREACHELEGRAHLVENLFEDKTFRNPSQKCQAKMSLLIWTSVGVHTWMNIVAPVYPIFSSREIKCKSIRFNSGLMLHIMYIPPNLTSFSLSEALPGLVQLCGSRGRWSFSPGRWSGLGCRANWRGLDVRMQPAHREEGNAAGQLCPTYLRND